MRALPRLLYSLFMSEDIKVVATNRRARHEYHLLSTIEAGIELKGSEVKSLRRGTVSIRDAYAAPRGEEVFIYNLHIAAYDKATALAPAPERPRRLLLHRRQINKLLGQTLQRGLTLVPLKLYFRGSWAKVELALARGKGAYDKRRALADREAQLELERALRKAKR